MLDKSMFRHHVQRTPVEEDVVITDETKEIVAEMKVYEEEKKHIRVNDEWLDPMAFWSAKAGVYPCLFRLALKMMSVPATSVLSEQVFSGAGRISTKERSLLAHKTIEQLVYLQRSMTKADAEELTAEDFQAERRTVMKAKKEKARQEAYDKALQLHNSAQEAYEEAENAVAHVEDGNDDNLYFEGETAYTVQDVPSKDDPTVIVDAALNEVFERNSDVSDLEDECDEMSRNYKYISGAQWRSWSQKKRDEWLFGGLD